MPGQAASVAKRLIGGIRALAPKLARAGTAELRRLLTLYSFKERGRLLGHLSSGGITQKAQEQSLVGRRGERAGSPL